MPPNRPAMKRSREMQSGPAAHVIVGIAHVIAGAVAALNFVFFTLLTDGNAVLTPISVILAMLAAVTLLGGLWLADGKRRGAFLALSVDALRLLLSFVATGGWSAIGLLINVALGAAVIWVLPRLNVDREADARRST
jgi:hypothetical protein